MWVYDRTVEIAQHFSEWYARIVIKDDVTLEEQGHFLTFDHEPSAQESATAGADYAMRRNLEEGSHVGAILSRYEFRARFTLEERVAIDDFEASALPADQKATVRTILKDFDAVAEIDRRHPATVEGVQYLELVGLLAAGRAAQILGA